VGKQSDRKLVGYLPLVLVATFIVAIVPMLLVLWLRTSGTVTSVWAGMAIGVAASFLASYGGGVIWKTRPHSRDVLFSDLMLWGWVQRWLSERRLNGAADLLGLTTGRPEAVSSKRLTNRQKAGLLTRLTSSLEARDTYTYGHSRRVARHAASVAKRMGLSRDEVAKVRAAGAMHDVGKVRTPIAVLRKEGGLSPDEYATVKRHPVDGAAMVAALDDDELTAMVRHHHERLDGLGYPDGLSGEAIPIGARILAVADTFDAITSTRSYRQAHSHREALDILSTGAGSQLDPGAVRAFCSCYSGRRTLAYWTILAHGRPRLLSLLGGGVAPAKAATLTGVMATAATTAAVGGAFVGLGVDAPKGPSRALADSGASPASATAQEPVGLPAAAAWKRAASDATRAPRARSVPGGTAVISDDAGPRSRASKAAGHSTSGHQAESSTESKPRSRREAHAKALDVGEVKAQRSVESVPTVAAEPEVHSEAEVRRKGRAERPAKVKGKANDKGKAQLKAERKAQLKAKSEAERRAKSEAERKAKSERKDEARK